MKNQPKMYLAKCSMHVMFVSTMEGSELKHVATKFLKEEYDTHSKLDNITVTEVTDMDSVPDDWKKNAVLWGSKEEFTVSQFLHQQKENKEEYEEYLRLYAKYGKPE